MIPYEIAALTWLGATCLALCALPQAFKAARDPGSTRGLSWAFLVLWGVGELAMFAGLLPLASWHVLANYAVNFVLVCFLFATKRWKA